MAKGEAIEKWRDEDGPPSPSQEWTDWWKTHPDADEYSTYPPDHGAYLQELYEEIRRLRLRVAELEAAAPGVKEGGAAT